MTSFNYLILLRIIWISHPVLFVQFLKILTPEKVWTLHRALCRWTADWKNVTADPEAPTKGHAFMYVECSVDFILISYSISGGSLYHSFTGSRCFSYAFRTNDYARFSQCLCAWWEKKWFEKYFTSVMLLLSVTDYIMCFKTSFCWNVNVPLYIYLSIEPQNHRTI